MVSGLLLRLRAGRLRGTWKVDLATVRLTEGERFCVGLAVRRYGHVRFLGGAAFVCLLVRRAFLWLAC